MERLLIIVARDRPELFQELSSTYGPSGDVEILLDRRQAPRRTFSRTVAARQAPIRLGPRVEGEGFFVIPRL